MQRLSKELKEKICKLLNQYYKAGEVWVWDNNEQRKQDMLESINPHFHKSEKICWGRNGEIKRRYRFNIVSENYWFRIKLNKQEQKHIVEECKQLLDAYNIKYEEVQLDTYYPYWESRMEYASWNVCLEIISKED